MSGLFPLIAQIPPEFFLCPFERPGDGAFMYPPALGDLDNIQLLDIVSQQGFSLAVGQFLPNHLHDPFSLDLLG